MTTTRSSSTSFDTAPDSVTLTPTRWYREPPKHYPMVDASAIGLEADLRARVRGEVRFDDGTRALYCNDGSNYRQVPIGVVIPRDADDVVEAVAVCRQYGAPIVPRGGGTSLAGQVINVAVVLDMSKNMRDVLEFMPERKLARVQPGCVLDTLRDQAEQRYSLTFPPDPATHAWCTLGGMIGNNSCGPHSFLSDKSGRTVDHIEELEIVTYDGLRMKVGRTNEVELDRLIREGGRRGAIYAKLKRLRDQYADRIRERYPKIPRLVSGYALDQLLPENGFNVAAALVGSEGTCVTVLEATTRLVHKPPQQVLLLITYDDVYQAGDHVPLVRDAGPMALEGIDSRFISDLKKKHLHSEEIEIFPRAGDGAYLLVEFGGETRQEAADKARALMERMRREHNAPEMKLLEDPAQQEGAWTVRESGLGATAYVPGQPENHEGWEDSAVPPERIGDYMRDLRKLFHKHGYEGTLYGHIGQGCVHTRINFDFRTRDGIETYRSFMEDASDLVVRYGGTLSGEHGDGQSRAEFLPKMFGEELAQAFREFKGIWDPAGKMNPGKLVDPYRVTDNLRQGTDYAPPTVQTHFQYPDDEHSFQEASLRCVGVGKCRATSGHTMCPSFQVTLEEKHTTRGRARLLFEMMQGETITDGWRSEEVHEALDLCLACKGCKGDCPVNVDMATYKAEFLSHYYAGRLRPRSGYSMGLIYWWARLASLMPGVANVMTHTPGLSHLAKIVAGVAQPREMPRFAPHTFKRWFRDRQSTRQQKQDRPRVILWADTFNDHFFPEVPQASVEVLEAAGFDVIVPEESLCCGRPLYDYGWLDQAKALLKEILTTLKSEIEAGTPIVGLEPSCVAVFRDELTNLFPHDQDAVRLSQQTFTLGEFLMKRAENYKPPKLTRKAVFHGHCHQKAVMGIDCDTALLQRMGLDVQAPETGCCGMAGSFGFEAGHYDISVKVGERVLLPAVREASKDTLIIADGFSCREQVTQLTDRRPLHLAQVLKMALDEGSSGPSDVYPYRTGAYPERRYLRTSQSNGSWLHTNTAKAAALSGAALAGGALLWRWRRK